MLSYESQAEYTDIKTTARAAEIIKASGGAVFTASIIPPSSSPCRTVWTSETFSSVCLSLCLRDGGRDRKTDKEREREGVEGDVSQKMTTDLAVDLYLFVSQLSVNRVEPDIFLRSR